MIAAIKAADRPDVPKDVPAEFAKLIGDCWDQEPAKRPSMPQVVDRLHSMLPADALLKPIAAEALAKLGVLLFVVALCCVLLCLLLLFSVYVVLQVKCRQP